jgi:hypothetical protein
MGLSLELELELEFRFGALLISDAHEDNLGDRRTFSTPSNFV